MYDLRAGDRRVPPGATAIAIAAADRDTRCSRPARGYRCDRTSFSERDVRVPWIAAAVDPGRPAMTDRGSPPSPI